MTENMFRKKWQLGHRRSAHKIKSMAHENWTFYPFYSNYNVNEQVPRGAALIIFSQMTSYAARGQTRLISPAGIKRVNII